MVGTIVVFLLFVLILYAYSNHHSEITATASAIHQIWSGSCRLCCRQREYSGISCHSGLSKGQNNETELDLTRVDQGHTSAGPSNNCICQSCPCAFIENVLRTCRPATNLYAQTIELISSYYYNTVRTLSDLSKYVEQAAVCGVSYQRQAQLISVKQLGSADNIHFINSTAVKAQGQKREDDPKQNIKGHAIRNKPDTVMLNEPRDGSSQNGGGLNAKQSQASKCCSESDASENAVQAGNGCSKCIEKGKTCIGICPRASGEGNKKEKK